MLEAIGYPKAEMFLVHFMEEQKLLDEYQRIKRISKLPTPNFVTRRGNNVLLEAFNATDHRMVVDIVHIGGAFVPVFAETAATDRYEDLVRFSMQSFLRALDSAASISRNELVRWLSMVRPKHIEALYDALGGGAEAVAEIVSQQLSENGPTGAMLRSRIAAVEERSSGDAPSANF